ncbi:MAG: 5'-methylthioadenosine/S-adenosylhomocysteine nucleosidase [Treponema sp.]|jgi:adenosylhomocysteine nucleosidase|nr:5'-methylthioadenosine/S-adenosylhomocysteine nucleosidase [Treponema sp.]
MIGIIGAMEAEVHLLKDAMENAKSENSGAFEFILGGLEGKDIVLLQGGIGKVNAAVGCALLIERYKPVLVINTGSAGGINPALTFGDIIISSGLVYYDVDVTAFNYKPGQVPGQPPVFPVAEALGVLAEKALQGLKAEGTLPGTLNSAMGVIASGDAFMHIPARIEEVRKTFPAVQAVDMESAAIAHTCALFKTPYLIIRALSDIAGTDSPVTHDEFLAVASKNSACLVRRIVKNYKEK